MTISRPTASVGGMAEASTAPLPPWLRIVRAHPRRVDAVLAALLTVLAVSSLWMRADGGTHGHPTVWFVLLALLSTSPLAWRRRWPLPVLILLVAAQLTLQVQDSGGTGWLVIEPYGDNAWDSTTITGVASGAELDAGDIDGTPQVFEVELVIAKSSSNFASGSWSRTKRS